MLISLMARARDPLRHRSAELRHVSGPISRLNLLCVRILLSKDPEFWYCAVIKSSPVSCYKAVEIGGVACASQFGASPFFPSAASAIQTARADSALFYSGPDAGDACVNTATGW